MDVRGKFIKELQKRLTPTQKKMFKTMKVETRKDTLLFRMSTGVISLEGIWKEVETLAEEMKVKVSRAEVFATLSELDDILGDIQWLWEGWVPRGFVTMIAGDPGIGKSAIAQHFVKIVTEGGCFPLSEKPLGEPRNVIWIDTESAQQIIKVRAGTMQIDKGRVYIPSFHGDILANTNLGSDFHRGQIIDLIEGVEPALVVLDSLGSAHAKGENKVEEMRPIMEYLASTARDYQIALLVVHHLNKDRKDESPEITLGRIRGSTVITANCRSIFTVEKSKDKHLKLNMIKSNLAVIGEPITAIPLMDKDKQFTGFEYIPYNAPPPKKNRKEICADWVYSVLEASPEKMVAFTQLIKLGDNAGYTRGTIYATRDLLGDRVMFSGTGNKVYWSIPRKDEATVRKIMGSNNGKVKHG